MTGTVETADWTEEDRAALLGLEKYEDTLCPGGCEQPRQTAWHEATHGLWEAEHYLCSACTTRDGQERYFSRTYIELGPDAPISLENLPPLQLGVNTVEPNRDGGRT